MLEPTNYETYYNSTISETFTSFRSFLLTLTITLTGVKKSLVLEPGTSKISGRTSIYFTQCPWDN